MPHAGPPHAQMLSHPPAHLYPHLPARPPARPPARLQGMSEEGLAPLEERFRTWYASVTREGLDISMCVDAKAALAEGAEGGGQCLLRLSGAVDDTALRETSPLFLANDVDLVPLGRAMRGDPPPPTPPPAAAQQQRGGSAAAGRR